MPATTEAFKTYFEQLKKFDERDATEHTLRPALNNLLTALAKEHNTKINVIPEPRHDESGRGAPDVKFKIGESILGYLENKKTDANLDQVLKSAQIAKYKKLSGNLLLTNYLEWIWLKDGAIVGRETLAYPNDVGYHKARLDPDKAEKTAKLIANFYSTPPKGIAKVKDLALALATRCHDLREFLEEELKRQEKEHQEGRLFGLFNVFKKDVFHELTLDGFADAFAQMLGYGLFLAKLNSGKSPVTLSNAKQYIPSNFELIRELVNFLDEMENPDYNRIKWLVEEILSIMNNLNMEDIKESLAFTKRQARLLEMTEEERLLFAKDPYVYFYEDFLKAYDPAMRKGRGVYYTPPPVVNFIVCSINDILKDTFEIKDGLADRKRVTVLDFATGTGTFLREVLEQIFDVVPEGLRDDMVREHALKNLYGFEYLIAPYTIAHLKLSQFLHDKGYTMQPKERLQIYLTNTLEPIEPQPNFLLPALSKEVERAQKIKEKPILVITGNPPYSGHSLNKGDWITGLMKTYKRVDGKPLGEKNSKWLQDDYVKFIRFTQWKMEQVEEGIVGIITNHSFLDNPTFRGMRQSLMQTFNQIYVLDLHGNNKKKEVSPDGGKDENVFDIEQGVSISLFVKKKGLERKILHADFWGKRKDKYRACLETPFTKVNWHEIQSQGPSYLFIPQDEAHRGEYENGWKVTDIFPVSNIGVVTHRDSLIVGITEKEIINRLHVFVSNLPDDVVAQTLNLKDNRDWKIRDSREKLKKLDWKENIREYSYRPFDRRYICYKKELIDRGCDRWDLMENMFSENVGLIVNRQIRLDKICHAFVTNKVTDLHILETANASAYLFPLYLYTEASKPKKNKLFSSTLMLFEPAAPYTVKKPNISQALFLELSKKYKKEPTPEEILGYIYAVLHSPTYRTKYAEFLKIDFPRIPFVDDRKVFETLSKLGWELIQAHLLKEIPQTLKVEINKGNGIVEKPIYSTTNQRLYINTTQYFSPVPEDVWNFQIGGYQVLDKYLKSRKGCELSLDEKENVMNVVKVLRFTIDQMEKIDGAFECP